MKKKVRHLLQWSNRNGELLRKTKKKREKNFLRNHNLINTMLALESQCLPVLLGGVPLSGMMPNC